MTVLVACEESQRVCSAFLERGFNGSFTGSELRSKTLPGIARAMAEQWG